MLCDTCIKIRTGECTCSPCINNGAPVKYPPCQKCGLDLSPTKMEQAKTACIHYIFRRQKPHVASFAQQ